jgi:hypothetical protein
MQAEMILEDIDREQAGRLPVLALMARSTVRPATQNKCLQCVRALNSARINLAQAIRFNSDYIARDEAAVKDCEQAVAYWKSEGEL